MTAYRIQATAFRSSGKMYSTGQNIPLGMFLDYPAGLARAKISELYSDLDQACGLPNGAIVTNNLTVLIQVLDDTDNPIVFQELVF